MKILLTCFFLLLSKLVFSQSIHGKITDQKTGDPLADVHIQIVNSSIGTITDNDGKFALERLMEKSVQIRISAIGYSTAFLGENYQNKFPVADIIHSMIMPCESYRGGQEGGGC